MRFAVLIPPSLLIATLLAGPAFGAASTSGKPAKHYTPPPAPPAPVATDAGLRGPLPPSTTPPVLALPPPGTGFATSSTGGPSPLRPITPVRAVGDPAPICRATCAETRYTCAASDDTECDSRWAQCAADCSAPPFRSTLQ